MNEERICKSYDVKKLSKGDTDKILNLCSKNILFYEYHPPFPNNKSIIEDMFALPTGKEYRDKFYLGIYEGDFLVAVIDLIVDYPKSGVVYIGFFMMDISYQKKGIATKIISEMVDYFKESGFIKIELAVDEGNKQSESFWLKNSFVKTGKKIKNNFSAYLPMERMIWEIMIHIIIMNENRYVLAGVSNFLTCS